MTKNQVCKFTCYFFQSFINHSRSASNSSLRFLSTINPRSKHQAVDDEKCRPNSAIETLNDAKPANKTKSFNKYGYPFPDNIKHPCSSIGSKVASNIPLSKPSRKINGPTNSQLPNALLSDCGMSKSGYDFLRKEKLHSFATIFTNPILALKSIYAYFRSSFHDEHLEANLKGLRKALLYQQRRKKKKTRISTNRNKLFAFEYQKELLQQTNQSYDNVNPTHKQTWKNQLKHAGIHKIVPNP